MKIPIPMYQVPKPKKNSSKKILENTIEKCKKAVLHFVQR